VFDMHKISQTARRSVRKVALTVSALLVASVAAVTQSGTAAAYVPAGVPLTPPMGTNTWYNFNELMTAENLKETADALVSNGLVAKGYNQVGIDGGWWTKGGSPAGRDGAGNIIPNPSFFLGTSFANMNQLTDYVHARGIKIGIYTDTGTIGCGSAWGSGNNEVRDARQFASWGFDYVKVDHCGGNVEGRTVVQTYAFWRDALNQSGRTMHMEICQWGGSSVWTWGGQSGRSWRTGRDISLDNGYSTLPRSRVTWGDVTRNFDLNNHPEAAGPGAFNDPDYLLIGGFGLTAVEEQSYFGMWAIAAAPLVLATDLRTVSAQTLDIIGNTEVIAVNQDSAFKQGVAVSNTNGLQVWSKTLADPNSRAVLLLNRSSATANVTVDFSNIGLGASSVRDLYAHAQVASGVTSYTASLPAHGSVLLKVTGTPAPTQRLRVMSTGMELNVDGASNADGARMIQWYQGSWPNQRFTFQATSGGYVRIVAQSSGKSVVVRNASMAAEAEIIQWYYSADSITNDEWLPESLGSDQYRYKNRYSGLYLTQPGTSAGNQFVQRAWTDASNQKFTLVP
jgi:alpha-galactosidase